jgi:hypothetical protein
LWVLSAIFRSFNVNNASGQVCVSFSCYSFTMDGPLSSTPLSERSNRERNAFQDQVAQIEEADWLCLYAAALRAGADAQDAGRIVEEVLLRARESLDRTDYEPGRVRLRSWMTSQVEKLAAKHLIQTECE